MPPLTKFYGIEIKMYFSAAEHNPPHIHAIYDNKYVGAIAIKTLKVLDGNLPKTAVTLIRKWIKQNEAELLRTWSTQEFKKFPPLL